MKNKMYQEILKQIYYGEFFPEEEIISDDPEYYKKSMKV